MKKKLTPILILFLTILVLMFGKYSTYYAQNALQLWLTNLVPVLFPFMILSNMFIAFGGIECIMPIFQPILGFLFKTSTSGSYALVVSLLFGMPMGSLTLATLLKQEKIQNDEARWLFLFCNQLSPAYMCNFVLPLFHLKCSFRFLFGFYGIPLIYGKLLYYCMRPICVTKEAISGKTPLHYLSQINRAIQNAGIAILNLGAYMILFGLFFLYEPILGFLHISSPALSFMKPALEISTGLKACTNLTPSLGIFYCAFGGLCCIAQTAYSVKDTILEGRLPSFMFHRIIITCLTGIYFLLLGV